MDSTPIVLLSAVKATCKIAIVLYTTAGKMMTTREQLKAESSFVKVGLKSDTMEGRMSVHNELHMRGVVGNAICTFIESLCLAGTSESRIFTPRNVYFCLQYCASLACIT